MGYRPPSAEPEGKWANAIHAKRRADGLSQTAAFKLLRGQLNLSENSRAAYVALDMGEREPREHEEKILAAWLGYWPEDPTDATSPPKGDTPGGLVAALEDQTKALNRLADQVEALVKAYSPSSAAALTADLVALSIRDTLPSVLRAAGLPPK